MGMISVGTMGFDRIKKECRNPLIRIANGVRVTLIRLCKIIMSDIVKKTTLIYTTFSSLFRMFFMYIGRKVLDNKLMVTVDKLKQADGNG